MAANSGSIGRFEFATATRIIFGAGALREAGSLAAEMGRRALVVTGRDAARAAPLLHALQVAAVDYVTYSVTGEPTVDGVRAGVELGRRERCDVVIGLGGGSALDAGKAIAALLANGGDPLDYLEVVGRGLPITRPAAPYLAIPTTAGTGAEVTRNAVLASPEHGVKASLRSPLMLPRVALVDPTLTYGLPPHVTAATGLDALTQLVEPFVSARATPLTDALCRDGIRRVARSLRRAYENGSDTAAREDMALASLFGGLALANAGLGAAHGLAGVIGGRLDAPHGAVCAALLPGVMAANLRAIRAGAPRSDTLARYDEIARLLTGSERAAAEHGVAWVREVAGALSIPALSAYGLAEAGIPAIAAQAAVASSTRANPVRLPTSELEAILRQAAGLG